jgi:riboflavin synthase
MFTGIIEEMGTLEARQEGPAGGSRLTFAASVVLDGSNVGESISVNGCCLTVVDLGAGWWSADAVSETLGRTNLGRLDPGDPVNLERAVSLQTRLGGHLVQGHVDGTGEVARAGPELEIEAPETVRRYLVEKGSVTVDGISLTVVAVGPSSFHVAVIPHTMEVTTLGRRAVGDVVNLEADVLAKYAERLLAAGAVSPYRDLAAARKG